MEADADRGDILHAVAGRNVQGELVVRHEEGEHVAVPVVVVLLQLDVLVVQPEAVIRIRGDHVIVDRDLLSRRVFRFAGLETVALEM